LRFSLHAVSLETFGCNLVYEDVKIVDRTSASIFKLIWISLLHNVVKRVRNRSATLRCVFDHTDVSGVRQNWVSLG
jgi:hypothetical protein